jgi:3-hydroxyacyl-[acyl-carrier-protein] dehydratase
MRREEIGVLPRLERSGCTKAIRRLKITNRENAGWVERGKWEELFHRLSHPFPTVVIDRVEEVEREKRIKAVKWITTDEFYLAGHFPGNPIMPGVLTLEGMVQSALILVEAENPRGKVSVSVEKVDRVRFKRAIVPGDRVEFLVHLAGKEGDLWIFKGKAEVDGETAAEANLILKVGVREVGFEL